MDTYLGAASPIAAIARRHDALATLRRDLHAHPELGFDEHRTAGIVARHLRELGIEVHTGIGRTGVVGVIPGRRTASGKSIGLRADMDALPIVEENEFGHRSTIAGKMHGCGHDGHTTMLLGAAAYLAATRQFDGTVVLIFQPGEEGYAGAKEMIEDGLFRRFPVDEVYALHNWPALPAGSIGLNPGPMMAAADRFEILVKGKGGHGAHPYQTVDPIVVAGALIGAIQTIVARNISPIEPAVVSLCAVQSGNPAAFSVLPGEALLAGTVRTFRTDVQDLVEARLRQIVEQTARAHGAEAALVYDRLYPATINHRPQYEHALAVAQALVGSAQVVADLPPSMGAEDFSFMLQAKPGCYMRLGQGGGPSACHLHNPRYDFNDAVIPLGAGYLAALAERRMPLGADAPPSGDSV